jgi:hypothetical protein
VLVSALVFSGTTADAASSSTSVVEHFNGKTYILTPGNWHGAKDCAIVAPTQAYCFSTDAAFAAFTAPRPSSAKATAPATTGTCDGYTKIWNGANWTGTGLAFRDYGYAQNLDAYVATPFQVVSWFSDGQRSYAPDTTCNMRLWTGFNATGNYHTLPANAHATNMPAYNTDSIELYHN